MRILPHHQDTGGFFVAVLEKVKSLPWETSHSTFGTIVNPLSDQTSLCEKEQTMNDQDKKRHLHDDAKPWAFQKKRKRVQGYKEDPFVFFKNENEDVWPSIQ